VQRWLQPIVWSVAQPMIIRNAAADIGRIAARHLDARSCCDAVVALYETGSVAISVLPTISAAACGLEAVPFQPAHTWRVSASQLIDLSFRLTVAPALADGVAHRLDVVAQVLRQAPHVIQPTATGIVQPGIQFRWIPAAKSHGQPAHGSEGRRDSR
jgi:hypothetical protein